MIDYIIIYLNKKKNLYYFYDIIYHLRLKCLII